MSIYRVKVISDKDSIMYTVGQTTLIVIVPSGDEYELTTMDNYVYRYTSLREATSEAEKKITRFFATLGIQPQFIND